MFVGIDFGTRNSSIGVFHNDQLRLYDLAPRHPETHVPLIYEDALMPDGLPFPKQVFAIHYSWQNIVELSTI